MAGTKGVLVGVMVTDEGKPLIGMSVSGEATIAVAPEYAFDVMCQIQVLLYHIGYLTDDEEIDGERKVPVSAPGQLQ